MPGSFYDTGVWGPFDNNGSNILGVEPMPRDDVIAANATLTSQLLLLSYFTAPPGVPLCTQILTATGATAAAASPTIARMGLYSIAANGDGTLVASSANDTTLWNAVNTEFIRALSVAYQPIPGQRYAFAALCVTAVAAPVISAGTGSLPAGTLGRTPKLTGSIAAQANLPATFLAANSLNTVTRIYGALVP